MTVETAAEVIRGLDIAMAALDAPLISVQVKRMEGIAQFLPDEADAKDFVEEVNTSTAAMLGGSFAGASEALKKAIDAAASKRNIHEPGAD
jgi:hypothetical protein